MLLFRSASLLLTLAMSDSSSSARVSLFVCRRPELPDVCSRALNTLRPRVLLILGRQGSGPSSVMDGASVTKLRLPA